MAGPPRLRARRERGGDFLHEIVDDPVPVRHVDPSRPRGADLSGGHPEPVEVTGQGTRAMEGAQHLRDPGEHVRVGHGLGRHRVPGYEAGDEHALGFDERDDVGSDRQPGGPRGRFALEVSVDLEQVGVGAGDSDHVALAVAFDERVAVGDPAVEWPDHLRVVAPAGHPRDDLGEIDRGHDRFVLTRE